MTEELPHEPGLAMLVVPMPGSVRPPTDCAAAMIAWLSVHGAPRTAGVLRRLRRHAWAIEPPDPDAATQTELWATARFADVDQARAAARPYHRRVNDLVAGRPPTGPPRRRGAVRRPARALSGPDLGEAHGGRKPGPQVFDPWRTGRHKPRLRASWLRSRASCSGAVRVRSSSMCSSSRTARR